MFDVTYQDGSELTPEALCAFYDRLHHEIAADPNQIRRMMSTSTAFVTAYTPDGSLIGVARGLCDGVRGYLTECKLDPKFQGPAAVTRTDGRIEHDQHGIAAEMARRVLERLADTGITRVDVLAYGTEVDFLEDLGFKRAPGLVGLTLRGTGDALAATAAGHAGA